MHRINFLIIITIILQITIGCKSDNKKAFQDCVNLVKEQLSNRKIDFIVIIPNQGCAGCISYMEDFYIHNNENPSIAFVFTNITSLKILKMKIKINDSSTYLDIDNRIMDYYPENKKLYPCIIELNDGKIKSVHYQSPQEDGLFFLIKKLNIL